MGETSQMKFRSHETFFIRKGWLSKGMRAVQNDPLVFMRSGSESPTDTLGLGANMVKALRYWLQATGLTIEPKSGKRSQQFTDFGKLVFENDPYFEETGTLWALHFLLASNKALATSWYYFFNEFNMRTFSKDDFTKAISNYLALQIEKIPSQRSLEDDFNCILGTYISREKLQPGKTISPENNIDCPLGELGIVDVDSKAQRTFKKRTANINLIPNSILLFGIIYQLQQNPGQSSRVQSSGTPIESLLNERGSIGKIFNLDSVALLTGLYRLENSGCISVVTTAGIDEIRVRSNKGWLECLADYYKEIG